MITTWFDTAHLFFFAVTSFFCFIVWVSLVEIFTSFATWTFFLAEFNHLRGTCLTLSPGSEWLPAKGGDGEGEDQEEDEEPHGGVCYKSLRLKLC